jgi:DNA-binding NarL/FixJ family response regulator
MDEMGKMAAIVTKPGSVRNSLHALLTTLPQIEGVAEADRLSTLFRMGAKVKPDLVLIEADLIRTCLQKELRTLRSTYPQAQCIVLVENDEERHLAESTGVDAVIFKGFRAAKLMKTVEGLLA